MPNAGQKIRALDFAASATDVEDTSGTTTSASFTSTLTGGTACEVTFMAPTSGKVLIVNSCQLVNAAANSVSCGWRLGTGSTPGGGSQVVAASINRAVRNNGTNLLAASHSYEHTGLTAGSTYNIQQQFVVGAGTGTYMNKSLTVVPLPA